MLLFIHPLVLLSSQGVLKWLEMTGFTDYTRAFLKARVTGGRLLRMELGELMSDFQMEYADAQYFLHERERLRSVAAGGGGGDGKR